MRQTTLMEDIQTITPHAYEVYRYNHLPNDGRKARLTSAEATFVVRLLGDFQLVVHELHLSGLDVPRLQSLLAYLILHHGVPQSRTRLAYLFWPDSNDGQAHTNLRNLLHKLRTTLPEIDSFLSVDRQVLCWLSDAPWRLDVLDFEHAIGQARQAALLQDSLAERLALEAAVGLYQGDLFPACYDDWIYDERESLQQKYVDAMERLIEILKQQEQFSDAIRTTQRLLHYNPQQETTYQSLMQLYAARGDRGAVLRTYRTCVTVLRRDLAVEPGPTTHEIYTQLMRAEK